MSRGPIKKTPYKKNTFSLYSAAFCFVSLLISCFLCLMHAQINILVSSRHNTFGLILFAEKLSDLVARTLLINGCVEPGPFGGCSGPVRRRRICLDSVCRKAVTDTLWMRQKSDCIISIIGR